MLLLSKKNSSVPNEFCSLGIALAKYITNDLPNGSHRNIESECSSCMQKVHKALNNTQQNNTERF